MKVNFYFNLRIRCNIMKVGSGLILFLLMVATAQAKPKSREILQVDQETTITFVIQEQASNHNQILKLKLEISQRDPSLVDAIQNSNDLRQQLTNIFEDFCLRFNQTCGDDIETSAYEIEAEYYHLRGKKVFKTFVIKFQMDFVITNFQSVGLLLDDFEDTIIDNHIVIRGIEWEDVSDEVTLEEIIDEGVDRAKKSCERLGMELFKIKSVVQEEEEKEQKKQQPPKKQDGQEQEQQEEQEEEEEQDQPTQEEAEKYKFVAVCRSYKPKPKPKPKKIQSSKPEANIKSKKLAQK